MYVQIQFFTSSYTTTQTYIHTLIQCITWMCLCGIVRLVSYKDGHTTPSERECTRSRRMGENKQIHAHTAAAHNNNSHTFVQST